MTDYEKKTRQDLTQLQQKLEREKFLQASVGSDSMRPWIRVHDLIVIIPRKAEELRTFDPVVFWDGQKLVVHLFLRFNGFPNEKGEKMILTQGLVNDSADLTVPVSQILGVAHKKKPWWLGPLLVWRRFRGSI